MCGDCGLGFSVFVMLFSVGLLLAWICCVVIACDLRGDVCLDWWLLACIVVFGV